MRVFDRLELLSVMLEGIMQTATHPNLDPLLDALFATSEAKRAEHKAYYRSHPQEYLDLAEAALGETTNGPLVGLLVSAAFTGFSGGLLAGAIALVSGLLQWWLAPQPEAPRVDAVFQPKYGTESLGGFARSGQSIPGVWTSRKLDPSGGVVVGGDLIHSRIETRDGNQYTYARFGVSLGEIGKINLNETTVNQQPIQQFSTRDISQSWQPGRLDQKALPDYSFYSQNLPVSVNQNCGAGLVSKSVESGTNGIGVDNIANFTRTYPTLFGVQSVRWYRLNSVPAKFFTIAQVDLANSRITINQDLSAFIQVGQTVQFSTPAGGVAGIITSLPLSGGSPAFTVPAEEFESFGAGSKYIGVVEGSGIENASYTPFRIIEKNKAVKDNKAYYGLVTDAVLPKGNVTIYSYNIVQYQTTKQVNRLDLNLQLQVWARDSKGSLIDFACMYTLWVKKASEPTLRCVCYFYVRSSNPATLFRSISIHDMALDSYQIEIRPEILYAKSSFTNLPAIELKSEGSQVSVPIAYGNIKAQGNLTSDPMAFLAAITGQFKDRTPDNSAQRGSTLVLQHVNEIQTIDRQGNPVDCSYKGLATVEMFIRASELINRSQNFAFFIEEGIVVNKLLAVYSVTGTSGNSPIFANPELAGLTGVSPLVARNLYKRTQGNVLSIDQGTVTTDALIDWEFGDLVLFFTRGSTCWWPEIYADLASNSRYGAADQIVSDFYLNYAQLCANTRWCAGDNEHATAFAWHGVISAQGELAVVNNDQSKKSLLMPSRSDGRAAFFEQKTPSIVALYNDHNSANMKLEYVNALRNNTNTVTIVYREQEAYYGNQSRLKFSPRDITVQTQAAYDGQVSEVRTVIQIPECTSYKQAAITAQVMLNIARYGGKIALTLDGSNIESFNLDVGKLIDVRTSEVVCANEYTGTVVAVGGGYNNDYFRLDKDLILTKSIAVGSTDGLSDSNIDFVAAGVEVGDRIRDIERGYIGSVTAVTSKSALATDLPFDDGRAYEIIDTTLSTLSMRIIGYDGTYRSQEVYSWIDDAGDGRQWLRGGSEQPEVGDVVMIGSKVERRRIFQCLSVQPEIGQISEETGRATASTKIIGTNWDDRFFNYSDTVLVSRFGVKLGGAI